MSNRKKLDLGKLRTKLIFRMIDDLNQPRPVTTVDYDEVPPVDDHDHGDDLACDCWCHQESAEVPDQARNR